MKDEERMKDEKGLGSALGRKSPSFFSSFILHPSSLYLAILILAGLLRILLLQRHGLWMDEFTTLDTIRLPYGEMIGQRLHANHLPLYFMMEKAWTSVFGTAEWSLRTISALFGWLAVWATARLAHRLGGWRLALPLTAAAAIHQFWLVASLEARMYSVVTWGAAESMDAYIAWVQAQVRTDTRPDGRTASRWALIRWTLVSAFSLNIHMLFLPVFLMETFDAIWRWWRRTISISGFAWAWLANLALCIPVSIAWAMNQSKFDSHAEWAWKGFTVVPRVAMRLLWGDYRVIENDAPQIVATALFIVAIGGLTCVLFRKSKPATIASEDATPGSAGVPARSSEIQSSPAAPRHELTLFAIGTSFYYLGIYFASMKWDSPVVNIDRYYLASAPFLLILGWAGIVYFPWRPWLTVPSLVTLALAFELFCTTVHFVGVGDGLREAVREVAKNSPEGRGVVFVLGAAIAQPLRDYYGQDLPKDCLVISRREGDEQVIRAAINDYSLRHREFWLLTYREKHSPIDKIVREEQGRLEPVGNPKDIGKATIQLLRFAGSP